MLAKAMRFEPEVFEVSDEEIARASLRETAERASRDASNGDHRGAFVGISLERLKREGPIRLNLPENYAPFAAGNFGTPWASCGLYSPPLPKRGRNPLPTSPPPHEAPQPRRDRAAKSPLKMPTPPVPSFLNSTFVNIDSLRGEAGEPTLEIHPADA